MVAKNPALQARLVSTFDFLSGLISLAAAFLVCLLLVDHTAFLSASFVDEVAFSLIAIPSVIYEIMNLLVVATEVLGAWYYKTAIGYNGLLVFHARVCSIIIIGNVTPTMTNVVEYLMVGLVAFLYFYHWIKCYLPGFLSLHSTPEFERNTMTILRGQHQPSRFLWFLVTACTLTGSLIVSYAVVTGSFLTLDSDLNTKMLIRTLVQHGIVCLTSLLDPTLFDSKLKYGALELDSFPKFWLFLGYITGILNAVALSATSSDPSTIGVAWVVVSIGLVGTATEVISVAMKKSQENMDGAIAMSTEMDSFSSNSLDEMVNHEESEKKTPSVIIVATKEIVGNLMKAVVLLPLWAFRQALHISTGRLFAFIVFALAYQLYDTKILHFEIGTKEPLTTIVDYSAMFQETAGSRLSAADRQALSLAALALPAGGGACATVLNIYSTLDSTTRSVVKVFKRLNDRHIVFGEGLLGLAVFVLPLVFCLPVILSVFTVFEKKMLHWRQLLQGMVCVILSGSTTIMFLYYLGNKDFDFAFGQISTKTDTGGDSLIVLYVCALLALVLSFFSTANAVSRIKTTRTNARAQNMGVNYMFFLPNFQLLSVVLAAAVIILVIFSASFSWVDVSVTMNNESSTLLKLVKALYESSSGLLSDALASLSGFSSIGAKFANDIRNVVGANDWEYCIEIADVEFCLPNPMSAIFNCISAGLANAFEWLDSLLDPITDIIKNIGLPLISDMLTLKSALSGFNIDGVWTVSMPTQELATILSMPFVAMSISFAVISFVSLDAAVDFGSLMLWPVVSAMLNSLSLLSFLIQPDGTTYGPFTLIASLGLGAKIFLFGIGLLIVLLWILSMHTKTKDLAKLELDRKKDDDHQMTTSPHPSPFDGD